MSVSHNRKTMIDNFTGDPNYQISEYRRSVRNMANYLEIIGHIVLESGPHDGNLISKNLNILHAATDELHASNEILLQCFQNMQNCVREYVIRNESN